MITHQYPNPFIFITDFKFLMSQKSGNYILKCIEVEGKKMSRSSFHQAIYGFMKELFTLEQLLSHLLRRL